MTRSIAITVLEAERAADALRATGHTEVADALDALANDTDLIEIVGHPADEFNNERAFQEGWYICECSGSSNGTWQLVQVDDPTSHEPSLPAHSFNGDEDAWKHVVKQALAGSQYHRNALTFIQTHNPLEWSALLRAHPELKPRVRVPAARRAA